MNSQLIVMLTYNDQTVKDAVRVFDTCKDLEQEFWGFKDIGLPKREMASLVQNMKDAGKTTFLEIVSYGEQECMDGARLAVEMGFDYLMGTLYYESVWNYLKDKDIRFMPFVGKVHGNPSILEGSIQEIIQDGKNLEAQGISGFDLLAFRHTEAPEDLAREFVRSIESPTVIAGSIDSPARLDFAESTGCWGFTAGTALFNSKFLPNEDFRANLSWVLDYIRTH